MKIAIDARLYGLEHAGPGRYVKNLIDELASVDKKNKYVILLRKKYFEQIGTDILGFGIFPGSLGLQRCRPEQR